MPGRPSRRRSNAIPRSEGRRAAESWALTLAEARSTLLRSIGTTDTAAWTPPVVPPRAVSGPFVPPGWTPGDSPDGPALAAAPPPDGAARAVARSRRRRHGLIVDDNVQRSIARIVALFVGAGFGATLVRRTTRPTGHPRSRTPPGRSRDGRRADIGAEPRRRCCFRRRWSGPTTSVCGPMPPPSSPPGAGRRRSSPSRHAPRCRSISSSPMTATTGSSRRAETIAAADVAAGESPRRSSSDTTATTRVDRRRAMHGDGAVTVEPGDEGARHGLARLRGSKQGSGRSRTPGFWFLASLEVYDDGRLGSCPAEFERGCWQAAIVPEASCDRLTVQYSFADGTTSQLKQSLTRADVAPGEPVGVVARKRRLRLPGR